MKKIVNCFIFIFAFLFIICIMTSCDISNTHTHSFSEWTIIKAPSCTEPGEQERSCSCGEKQTQTISITGHTFGNWITSKAPSCTESGEKERYCSCGKKQNQIIDATWHVWIDATCQSPKHCSKCRITVGTILDHKYNKDVCVWCNQKRIVFEFTNSFPCTFSYSTDGKVKVNNAYYLGGKIYFDVEVLGGKYYGFDYIIVDKDSGYTVDSGSWFTSSLYAGAKKLVSYSVYLPSGNYVVTLCNHR